MTNRTRKAALAAAAIAASLGIVQVARGPDPAETGVGEAGERFETPSVQEPEIRQTGPLRVDSFDVRQVAEGSVFGSPEDLLVTFHGQGFLITALAPRVLIGEDLVLDLTEVNQDGSQLYLLLTPELTERIEAAPSDTLVVANPGGLQDPERTRATVPASAAELLRPRTDARVRLHYESGAFTRELVR